MFGTIRRCDGDLCGAEFSGDRGDRADDNLWECLYRTCHQKCSAFGNVDQKAWMFWIFFSCFLFLMTTMGFGGSETFHIKTSVTHLYELPCSFSLKLQEGLIFQLLRDLM